MPRTKTTSIDMRKSSSPEGKTESKKRQASEMNQSELSSSPKPEDTAGPSNVQPPDNQNANMRPRRMRLMPPRTYPNRYQVLSEQLDKSTSSTSSESFSSESGLDQAPDFTIRARSGKGNRGELELVPTPKRSARSKRSAKQSKERKYVRVSLTTLCAYCRKKLASVLNRSESSSSSEDYVATPSTDTSEAERPVKRVQPKRAKRKMQ